MIFKMQFLFPRPGFLRLKVRVSNQGGGQVMQRWHTNNQLGSLKKINSLIDLPLPVPSGRASRQGLN